MNFIKRLLGKQAAAERDPTQSNAYDLIGGEATIRNIAHLFYQEMRSNPATQALLAIHPQTLDESEQKLFEFLSGWLGGPQLFTQRRGAPMLRARHLSFAIDEQMRDQWLLCMNAALTQAVKNAEHRRVIYQAISQLADHMRNQ
ncbi:group II truncated hemoglobin [Shewanella avicenniae]|uniref:Group II truncated hemoglobin n=1 Tax=Shewanella avicenniae TaxID=2814294 RepID=A0ABX7QRY7_9GAMM|nr:group II truncated hemoglobin [Shewanella avicenniae]QSX33716.1 group II truncated hemoglobin [Shewanella avicenniae]